MVQVSRFSDKFALVQVTDEERKRIPARNTAVTAKMESSIDLLVVIIIVNDHGKLKILEPASETGNFDEQGADIDVVSNVAVQDIPSDGAVMIPRTVPVPFRFCRKLNSPKTRWIHILDSR